MEGRTVQQNAASPKKRIKQEYEVLKVEFYMGQNDSTDIRAGGPATFAFWVFTSLPEETAKRLARDEKLQDAIRQRGGDGSFTVTKEWCESFVDTEEKFMEKCLALLDSHF